MGVGCLIYLMVGDLVWGHYYLLTIPVVLFLLCPDEKGHVPGRQKFVRWIPALFTFLLLAANPIAAFSLLNPRIDSDNIDCRNNFIVYLGHGDFG